MQDALIRKLESFEDLTEANREALSALTLHIRRVSARTDLISEGDPPNSVHLILDGYACATRFCRTGSARSWPISCPATSAT